MIIALSVILLVSMVIQSLTTTIHDFYGTYYRCEVTFIVILNKALTISYIIGLITIVMILIDIPLIIYALRVYDTNNQIVSKTES